VSSIYTGAIPKPSANTTPATPPTPLTTPPQHLSRPPPHPKQPHLLSPPHSTITHHNSPLTDDLHIHKQASGSQTTKQPPVLVAF